MRTNLENNRTRDQRHSGGRFTVVRQTLTGTYSIASGAPTLQFLDPGVSSRTVFLPPYLAEGGQLIWIVNAGNSKLLTVVDANGVSVATVPAGSVRCFLEGLGSWVSTIHVTTPLNVLDFGAVPDDSTDNKAAFQRAADAALAQGTGLYFPGNQNLTYRVSGQTDFSGISHIWSDGTTIKTTSATENIFYKNSTTPITIHGFLFQTSVTRSGGAAIYLDGAAVKDTIENNVIVSQYVGIWRKNSVGTNIVRNEITGSVFADIILDSPGAGDSGDGYIAGNVLSSPAATAGIDWAAGGGDKIIGNKFLGQQIGLLVAPEENILTTGILVVNGNSFDRQVQAGVAFNKSAGTSTLSFVGIVGNVFTCVLPITVQGASNWITQLTLHDNVVEYTGVVTAFNLNAGRFVSVSGNSFYSAGAPNTPAITTQASWPSSCDIGQNFYYNTNIKWSLNGNTGVRTGIRVENYTVAGLPSGVAGDLAFATNCRVFNGAGTQEGAGVGTGSLVSHNGTAWKIVGTNVTAVA